MQIPSHAPEIHFALGNYDTRYSKLLFKLYRMKLPFHDLSGTHSIKSIVWIHDVYVSMVPNIVFIAPVIVITYFYLSDSVRIWDTQKLKRIIQSLNRFACACFEFFGIHFILMFDIFSKKEQGSSYLHIVALKNRFGMKSYICTYRMLFCEDNNFWS